MIFNRSFSLSVLVLTTVLLSCRAAAQISTQDWINDGRNKLKLQTPQALQQAEASFREALKKDPNNAEANVLRVGARLALEIQTPEVVALLTDFGCTDIQADTYNWLFTAPQDEDGRLKPRNGARSDALLGYLAGRETLANELLGGLEKVTNENFRIVLTAEETSTTPVHIDYADVCILRAIFYLGKAIQAFGSSYNLSAEYALFYRLFVLCSLSPLVSRLLVFRLSSHFSFCILRFKLNLLPALSCPSVNSNIRNKLKLGFRNGGHCSPSPVH